MIVTYECPVIGDGQSIETAFKPLLATIIDPETNKSAFVFSRFNIDYDRMICVVSAEGNHDLVKNNPDFKVIE